MSEKEKPKQPTHPRKNKKANKQMDGEYKSSSDNN